MCVFSFHRIVFYLLKKVHNLPHNNSIIDVIQCIVYCAWVKLLNVLLCWRWVVSDIESCCLSIETESWIKRNLLNFIELLPVFTAPDKFSYFYCRAQAQILEKAKDGKFKGHNKMETYIDIFISLCNGQCYTWHLHYRHINVDSLLHWTSYFILSDSSSQSMLSFAKILELETKYRCNIGMLSQRA